MKEYLDKQSDDTYKIIKVDSGCVDRDWVEVPKDADTFIELIYVKGTFFFFKTKGNLSVWDNTVNCWRELKNESVQDYLGDHTVLWERTECEESPLNQIFKTAKDNRVEYFEKFLNGAKLQYRIGSAVGNENSNWNNITSKSLQNFVHNPIEFREAPKFVTLNGIEFKSIERLINHVKNNYDLQS